MAGTYAIVKIKVFTESRLYEREDETDWVSAKEKIPEAYKVASNLIIDVIQKIIKEPNPPKLKKIVWGIHNAPSRHVSNPFCGRFLKGGEYTEFEEGDPPIAFMTRLDTRVDDMIKLYREAYNDPSEKDN